MSFLSVNHAESGDCTREGEGSRGIQALLYSPRARLRHAGRQPSHGAGARVLRIPGLKNTRVATVLGLWFSLVFPSLFVTQKFLGTVAVVCYVLLAGLAVAMWRRSTLRFPASNRAVAWWAVATLAVVITAFLLIFPRVNSHVPGQGSDDDDAYNVGAMALVDGQFPYAKQTYLGNALHQLPGAFVLALPFVLAGTSALQNLFWLPMFFLAVRTETRDGRTALHLAWLVVAFSPIVLYQVLTGTGHVSNTIYVALGLWWLTRTSHRDLAALLWGVALASRANFLLLVPLAFGWLRQHQGWTSALRAMALTLATVASLTLPFYFHDPSNFGPLDAADRVLRFDVLFPHAGEMMTVLTLALALALSWLPMDRRKLFKNCALVQAVFPVAGTLLPTLQNGHPDLAYATYGTFFAWFVLMADASQPSGPIRAEPRSHAAV